MPNTRAFPYWLVQNTAVTSPVFSLFEVAKTVVLGQTFSITYSSSNRCDVAVGEARHDRMILGDDIDLVVALVLVPAAGHAKHFAPVVDFGVPIGVHGAVNHDGVGPGMMRAA